MCDNVWCCNKMHTCLQLVCVICLPLPSLHLSYFLVLIIDHMRNKQSISSILIIVNLIIWSLASTWPKFIIPIILSVEYTRQLEELKKTKKRRNEAAMNRQGELFQSVEDTGVQANYLAIAPGKLLVYCIYDNFNDNSFSIYQHICVGWRCVERQCWKWWGTSHRSWSGLGMASI